LDSRYHKGLHYFALATAGCTFLLVIAGALVTSNDAGLSVPDWPLSHGQWMPEMVGGVFYEHGHRMVATTVGLLTIVLNIFLWRVPSYSWVRALGLVALAAVIAQGVLGGVTVLFFLPTPISVLHASIAPLFFCMVITLSVVTSPNWVHLSRFFREGWRRILKDADQELKLAIAMTLAVYLQHVLGATVRHSGTVDGTKGAVLVTWALLVHVVGALAVTGLIIYVARVFIKQVHDRSILRLVYLQLSLLFAQLLLGLGAYLVRIDPANQVQPTVSRIWITTSHLTIGVLLLATSLVVTLKLIRERESVSEPAWVGSVS
jgi:cytochrome c oxidase assembly protein subunit 15